MALLQGDPGTLTLYFGVELPPDILSTLKRDFALGAREGYSPLCRLLISDRKDVRKCKTPEDVLRLFQPDHPEEEDYFEDFLWADRLTLDYGQEGVVWYVSGWAKEEVYEPDDLAEGVDKTVVDGRYNFANKQLIYINFAPTLYANLAEANISISESFEFPYDPHAKPVPDQGGIDWRFEEPNPAQVIADASQYESRAIGEHNSELKDGEEVMYEQDLTEEGCMMYKLKEEVAARLGLKASWELGSRFGAWDGLDEEARRKLYEAVKDKSTAVEFSQEWVWNPPGDIEERVLED